MKKKNISGFSFDANAMINLEDPNLTDEELMWERLKHGIKEQSTEDYFASLMAEEIRKEIDTAMLAEMKKLAKGE